MLNKNRLLSLLNEQQSYFAMQDAKPSDHKAMLIDIWQALTNNQQLYETIIKKNPLAPTIQGQETFGASYPINITYAREYNAYAFDGSQIYPDHHQGFLWYLLNIGTVHINYHTQQPSIAHLESHPYIYQATTPKTESVINRERQYLELKHALTLYTQTRTDKPSLVLLDGSLIVAQLQYTMQKNEPIAQIYTDILMQAQESSMLCAWYISASQSQELISLLSKAPDVKESSLNITNMRDTDILSHVLLPYHYTPCFLSGAHHYGIAIPTCFIYVHYGYEIARIEFPYWISKHPSLINHIISYTYDQVQKGYGYPLVLAEAHKQAVINAADKDFFYYTIKTLYKKNKKLIQPSFKEEKKIKISI